MPLIGPKKLLWTRLAPFFLIALFVMRSIASFMQQSSTWDETHYFGIGKYLLINHRWDVQGSILHPPLSYYLHSIPLLFVDTDPTVWKTDSSLANSIDFRSSAGIERGQALLSSPANRGDRLLGWSRFMMTLTAALLGWAVYAWSYSLYGAFGAALALGLYTFDPNILAHAGLITPDIVLTTFSFLTVYYYWKLWKHQKLGDAVIGGSCFGLALLSKFSSILLFPICLALLFIPGKSWTPQKVRYCVIFGLVGVVILFVGYGMNLEPYFAGIQYQRDYARNGHPTFLCGQRSMTGWWYYFLVAFGLKTPIAAMIIFLTAAILWLKRIRSAPWFDEAFLLLPPAVFFCFFSVHHLAIGLRYILPIYPFLFVFAGRTVQLFFSRKLWMTLGIALATWEIGASCYIQPHYLAYFNELAGGPRNGCKYLIDSNLDWGQDLKGLKRYMDEHGIARISLSYFGTDTPERYGISYAWLPSFVLRNPNPEKKELERWVAVSATMLQGGYANADKLFAVFRSRAPVATIGHSIFVYDTEQ